MHFKVINKEIFYTDRVWKNWLRCIPKDEEFVKKIIMSRNKIPQQLLVMFNLSEQDQKDYDLCVTEDDVSEKIIFDAQSKGLILIKKEKIENEIIQ